MKSNDSNYEKLIAYAAGEVGGPEGAAMERELERNADAAATVSRFRAAMSALRSDRSEAPPAETLAAAKALFRKAASPSLFERLKRVLAQLVYDSRVQPALVGVRGASEAYQLSYESAAADVDVQVEPAESADFQRQLMGQVTLHSNVKIDRVIVYSAGTEHQVATANVDPGGVFSLHADPGVFDLWLAATDTVVVLPNVEIR